MLIQEMLSSLDIHLLSIGRANSGKEWNYRNVNNFYNRLLLVLDGEATISHHGREYQLGPNDLHLVPCYVSVNYLCPNKFDHYYITFTSRAFGGVDICSIQEYDYQRKARARDHDFFEQMLSLNPTSELPVKDPTLGLYRQYHEEQFRTYHEKSARIHLDNMSYISLLLSPFITSRVVEDSRGNARRLFAFLCYVEEHLHHPISIKDVADHLAVTPNYLSDWLASQFRFRPVEYINRRRIEEAQKQLIITRKSIKEISYDLGFSSVSYFSRVFKAQTGVAASRYRSLYR